jgi:hypothetical protein
MGPGAVDLGAADLDDAADGDGVVAAEVEDALEDEAGVGTGDAAGGGVTGFECEAEEGAGVEGAVVIRISWQDKMM